MISNLFLNLVSLFLFWIYLNERQWLVSKKLNNLSSTPQAVNMGGGEQLSSIQIEDLIGMIRNAEKSRMTFSSILDLSSSMLVVSTLPSKEGMRLYSLVTCVC